MKGWMLASVLAIVVRPSAAGAAVPRVTGAAALGAAAHVALRAPHQEPPLFSSHDVVRVTLTADLEALEGDRRESPDRPGVLTLADGTARTVEIPVTVRTRGSFRRDRANCSFPPLRLDFEDAPTQGTVLEGQTTLKLVSSCHPERSSYDELVLKEYLAYRSVRIVTDRAFGVRLLEVTFADAGGRRPPRTRPAFVIEDADALARRLDATSFDLEEGKNLPVSAFDPLSLAHAGVVEYMLGGTDWSDVAGHNVEIFDRGGVAVAVPYDFDMTGLVDPPYATTNPAYGLSSVRERYYRGWCQNPLVTRAVLDAFRGARMEILELWASYPGLSDETRGRAIRYLEDFFSDIESDDGAQRRFLRDCRSPG
jgi:hypothetical protein